MQKSVVSLLHQLCLQARTSPAQSRWIQDLAHTNSPCLAQFRQVSGHAFRDSAPGSVVSSEFQDITQQSVHQKVVPWISQHLQLGYSSFARSISTQTCRGVNADLYRLLAKKAVSPASSWSKWSCSSNPASRSLNIGTTADHGSFTARLIHNQWVGHSRSGHHELATYLRMLSSKPEVATARSLQVRTFSQLPGHQQTNRKMLDTAMYVSAVVVFMLGLSYAAVPLYQMFCQATGYAGTVKSGKSVEDKIKQRQENPNPQVEEAAAQREVTVWFSGDVAEGLPWKFEPTQDSVTVKPGESTLVFFTAHNLSDQPITGVSTYNVLPDKAAYYFNKIQCFCFEEQRLQAGEKVDMPVFFYIDPEYATDRYLKKENDLTLSYTFFKVEDEDEADAVAIAPAGSGVKLHGSGELPPGIAPPK